MKKIYYIPFLLIGSILIFISLPLANYCSDQWRVLHHDYNQSYRGISPNKSFLKVKYLLDNKEKYDTILMGSSRSGYMNSKLISKNAYNMKFNFALAKTNLHNLKTLLENNVKFNHLWLGVNDYVIWKNPNDHEFDFQRKTYKNNFLDKLDTYSFYLLKKIDDRDIDILKGKYQLYQTEEIVSPDKINMKTAKMRELYALKNPKSWMTRMTKIRPTLLGYQDNEYRIDQAIEEIASIKKLCEDHDINLTVFMYPSFYKTYLQFNQYKIEAFKRKLVKVTSFYDFYGLNEISLNEMKWQDSSHFHESVGQFMINKIKENKFLVTVENIDERIYKTRKMIENIVLKELSIKYLYKFNSHIDLSALKSIATSKNNYIYNDLITEQKNGTTFINVKGMHPYILLKNINLHGNNGVFRCDINSLENTVLKIYYKKIKNDDFSNSTMFRVNLKKGSNKFNLLIPTSYLKNDLRIDFSHDNETYEINDFSIFELR
jgi:hypothetical protein